jgi:hypothetical protein
MNSLIGRLPSSHDAHPAATAKPIVSGSVLIVEDDADVAVFRQTRTA